MFDHSGNFYVADSALPNAGMIRKISTDGTIHTVARGVNLLPANTPFLAQRPVAVDGGDNLYFMDGMRIRKLATDGTITTVVGQGAPVVWPQGAVAHSIAVDGSGNLYIAGLWVIDEDTGYGRLWMVLTDGRVEVGSRFDITTGAVINGPATKALKVYAVLGTEGAVRIYV